MNLIRKFGFLFAAAIAAQLFTAAPSAADNAVTRPPSTRLLPKGSPQQIAALKRLRQLDALVIEQKIKVDKYKMQQQQVVVNTKLGSDGKPIPNSATPGSTQDKQNQQAEQQKHANAIQQERDYEQKLEAERDAAHKQYCDYWEDAETCPEQAVGR